MDTFYYGRCYCLKVLKQLEAGEQLWIQIALTDNFTFNGFFMDRDSLAGIPSGVYDRSIVSFAFPQGKESVFYIEKTIVQSLPEEGHQCVEDERCIKKSWQTLLRLCICIPAMITSTA